MKNTIYGGLTAVALLSLSGVSAFAIPTITITGNGDYRSGDGGEFNVRAANADGATLIGNVVTGRGYVVSGATDVGNANGTAMSPSGGLPLGFQTFCIERNEFIVLPGTYSAAISSGSINGGYGGGNPDPISEGTAFLYYHFATRILNDALMGAGLGYNYANGGGRAADAALLQKAIWYLEDELTLAEAGGLAGNRFLAKVNSQYGGSLATAKLDNGSYNVGALNLGGDPDFKQDQLILNDFGFSVPDGGMTVLLMGLGFGGLAFMRRKLA